MVTFVTSGPKEEWSDRWFVTMDYLDQYDPEKGRIGAYLMTIFKRRRADAFRKECGRPGKRKFRDRFWRVMKNEAWKRDMGHIYGTCSAVSPPPSKHFPEDVRQLVARGYSIKQACRLLGKRLPVQYLNLCRMRRELRKEDYL